MQLHIPKGGFTEGAQSPLRAGDCGESQRAQAAHPIDPPVAPLHLAIKRVILLLDEAVDAPVERVSNIAGVPTVAIIPSSSRSYGVDPVVEPRSVSRGIACARLMRESPGVLNGNLKIVLRKSTFPLEPVLGYLTLPDTQTG